MVGFVISLAAAFYCYRVALTKQLGTALVVVLFVGYVYGITRWHITDVAAYFLFDAATIGFYSGSIRYFKAPVRDYDEQKLRHWVTLLIAWTTIMVLLPMQDYLVQVVGFRGNVFFLGFLLIGAKLVDEDFYSIGLSLSLFNIMALGFGAIEFFFGLQTIVPLTESTYLIYKSNDVGANGAFRIPAIFVNAHAYGGVMVASIPFIVAAWSLKTRKPWHRSIMQAGLLSAAIGVFLCAARLPVIVLGLIVVTFMISTKLRPSQRVATIVIFAIVGYLVSESERMQRFTTLENRGVVEDRLHTSVNQTLWQILLNYPMGIGIGAGGTSMPHFLEARKNAPVSAESELGRTQLELGLIGTTAWIGFFVWFFLRRKPQPDDPCFIAKRLAWVTVFSTVVSGLIGIGLFTSIPQTSMIMLLCGWIGTPNKHPVVPWKGARTHRMPDLEREPAVVPSN